MFKLKAFDTLLDGHIFSESARNPAYFTLHPSILWGLVLPVIYWLQFICLHTLESLDCRIIQRARSQSFSSSLADVLLCCDLASILALYDDLLFNLYLNIRSFARETSLIPALNLPLGSDNLTDVLSKINQFQTIFVVSISPIDYKKKPTRLTWKNSSTPCQSLIL